MALHQKALHAGCSNYPKVLISDLSLGVWQIVGTDQIGTQDMRACIKIGSDNFPNHHTTKPSHQGGHDIELEVMVHTSLTGAACGKGNTKTQLLTTCMARS